MQLLYHRGFEWGQVPYNVLILSASSALKSYGHYLTAYIYVYMYNIESKHTYNIEAWEHTGDGNFGIVVLRTGEEKGSLMHHLHRKAAPLLRDKARSAHVMSSLSKYLFKIYCYSNFR